MNWSVSRIPGSVVPVGPSNPPRRRCRAPCEKPTVVKPTTLRPGITSERAVSRAVPPRLLPARHPMRSTVPEGAAVVDQIAADEVRKRDWSESQARGEPVRAAELQADVPAGLPSRYALRIRKAHEVPVIVVETGVPVHV